MNEFILDRGEPQAALSHLALYGLGAILENAGHEVRLTWTSQVRSRPSLTGPDVRDETIASAVRDHAARHADTTSWIQRDITLRGALRGLMSPRLSTLGDDRDTWQSLQDARHEVLDHLTSQRHWLDLLFLAALGEPAYWSINFKGDLLQDDGASRWEMQPRNQGSEIVRTRLRKLATEVAAREPTDIAAGLRGSPEAGGANPSPTAGLTASGQADNALVWSALWGISQLPMAPRTSGAGRRAGTGTAITTGHLGRSHNEWFYVPMWHQPWRPARLRSLLASAQLRTAASSDLTLDKDNKPSALTADTARRWLTARGVIGLIRFPIERFGSDNAPERRAMHGELVRVRR